MKPNKNQIVQFVRNELGKRKVRYSIEENTSQVCIFSLHLSFLECGIQVEYNLDDVTDDYYVAQFYISEFEEYTEYWESNSDEDISGYIDELIHNTKNIVKAISKIQTKIEQIDDICKENGLDMASFIDVIYNFE